MQDPNNLEPNHWTTKLSEGVILLKNNRVASINKAALELLNLSETQALNQPLIGVLRDHRLEQAFLQQKVIQCETRGRFLRAVPLENGLILEDETELILSKKNAKELLAVLSHELRTPVTVIRSTLEALQSEMPDELRKRFMDRAVNESERLVRLLEDLTVDVKPPRFRRVELRKLTQRALVLVQTVLTRHNVQVVTDIEDLTVWADEDKLLQVFINLLENAAIHGPDDSEIKLVIEQIQDSAFLRVQDQGEPLVESRIDELFEPHARGESRKTKGTGLGLYIVKNIVNSFDGEVWGRSIDSGNEFGVSLPIKR